MKITKNSVVALSYELIVDGSLADKAVAETPLEYIHGTGALLPRFAEELLGKEAGESFAFVLSPEEGYGVHNAEYVFDIPIEAFAIDGEIRRDLLQLGRTIPMLNSAGQVVQGTIREIRDEAVTMDFNHPMAGKTLHFSGKVESVREASEKELNEGLHGEYLPQEDCHCKGKCHGEGDGEGCCHKEGEGCCHEEGEGCCHKEGEGCCHKEGCCQS